MAAHRIAEEKNIKLIRKENLKTWLQPHNVTYKIENFAYTPPFPKFMTTVYDYVDLFIKYIWPFNNISVMLFVSGTK